VSARLTKSLLGARIYNRPGAPDVKEYIKVLRWPSVVVIALIMFHSSLEAAITAVSEGEITWDRRGGIHSQIQKLATSASDAAQRIPSGSATDQKPAQITTELAGVINQVIDEASISPKVALMKVPFALEKKAQAILAAANWAQGRTDLSLDQSIIRLSQLGQIAPFIPSVLSQFDSTRSRILQNANAVSDAEVISAVDSGLTLLRILYSLPVERNVVYYPGVAVFSDAGCTQLITGVKGLVLETTSPGEAARTFRIFPTTRNDYVKGEILSWEWNMNRVWGAAWYRDPKTNEIKVAWGQAAEFVGRNLDHLGS
jgi:hypothetical protein